MKPIKKHWWENERQHEQILSGNLARQLAVRALMVDAPSMDLSELSVRSKIRLKINN